MLKEIGCKPWKCGKLETKLKKITEFPNIESEFCTNIKCNSGHIEREVFDPNVA